MPIHEMAMQGLLKFTVTDPLTNQSRDISDFIVHYTDERGSTRDGPTLTADAGSFTLTLLDDSEDLWEDKFDFLPDQIIRPVLRTTGEALGTFRIQDIADSVEYDDEGELTKTVDITGVDDVQRISNISVPEVMSAARSMTAVVQLKDDHATPPKFPEDYSTMALYTTEEFRAKDASDGFFWWKTEHPGSTGTRGVQSTVDAIEPSTESVNDRVQRLIDISTGLQRDVRERNASYPLIVGRVIYAL